MANNQPPSLISTSSHITTLYRQNLSNFLFLSDPQNGSINSRTSWIGDTARSLALRAATPFADETAANTANQNDGKKQTPKKSNTNNSKFCAGGIVRTLPPHWSDFVCMACGTFLFQPTIPTITIADGKDNNTMPSSEHCNIQLQSTQTTLPSNIYIRSLKRGRTRRRRASRSKAKQLHDHSLSLQRRGASNSNIQLRKETLVKENMQRIASSYCVGDGRAKNCLVMCCTFCGTKKKRKGVEVEKNPKSGGGKVVGGVQRNAGQKERYGKEAESRLESESTASQICDNSDFISLTPTGNVGKKSVKSHQDNDSSQVNAGKRQNGSDAFTSPLLRGKKKKKKKTPDTKKGDLMDFLSSLND